MNIGICTTDFETMPIQVMFEKIHRFGFQSVQLSFATVEECQFQATGEWEIPSSVPGEVISEILLNADRYGLSIQCVNGTYNMAHPDQAVRDEGVRRFSGFARAVRALGCANISLCTGTRERSNLWRPHPDNQTESAWRDMIGGMRELIQIAQSEGLTLLVETEASNVIDTPAKARRMLDEIGSPHLKMILDCANLFHSGQAHAQNVRPTIQAAFDAYGQDIFLAHGKDIQSGDGIAFCAAGEGIVDFDYTLELLKGIGYSGDMLLHGIYDESKMPAALAFIREKILAG